MLNKKCFLMEIFRVDRRDANCLTNIMSVSYGDGVACLRILYMITMGNDVTCAGMAVVIVYNKKRKLTMY